MTTYRRVSTPVQAWQFNNQPQSEWPDFVKNYEATNPLNGPQPVGVQLGVLLIPARGETIKALPLDWVVIENGVLQVFKNETFSSSFEAIGDETVHTAE